jgi:hypothetical protein
MADIKVSQAEADHLLSLEKKRIDDTHWGLEPASRVAIPLTSLDGREHFLLDVARFQIKLTKATFQNRAKRVLVLLRLDIDGPPHRNPDGEEVSCPHLHVYREGYGTKWAIPLPKDRYPATSDLTSLLEAFMRDCKITDPPILQPGLF